MGRGGPPSFGGTEGGPGNGLPVRRPRRTARGITVAAGRGGGVWGGSGRWGQGVCGVYWCVRAMRGSPGAREVGAAGSDLPPPSRPSAATLVRTIVGQYLGAEGAGNFLMSNAAGVPTLFHSMCAYSKCSEFDGEFKK